MSRGQPPRLASLTFQKYLTVGHGQQETYRPFAALDDISVDGLSSHVRRFAARSTQVLERLAHGRTNTNEPLDDAYFAMFHFGVRASLLSLIHSESRNQAGSAHFVAAV